MSIEVVQDEADVPQEFVRAMKRVTSVFASPEQDAQGLIQNLFQSYAPLAYGLPWQTLDYVELLATYNPDYSQAVENIKMLANSGHQLHIEAGSELKVRRIRSRLEKMSRTIQESHGGVDGIIEKMMDQAAVFGAMAGEFVVNDSMTGVVDFVDINPKSIRFFWEEDDQRYAPYQKVKQAQAQEAEKKNQKVIGSCVKLNEVTFRYYAFDAAPQSPYGVPPFLAALQNIAIQRDMVLNMAQIVKKIGLLAIIDMTVDKIKKRPSETEEQYYTRASQYLSDYADAVEDMAKEGGLVHYDDTNVKTYNIAGNAAGATNIFKQNEELIFSGLKSMPSVQGRSFSTTETYAGVAYEIVLRNTVRYQRAAKRFIEYGYWLDTQLSGEQADSISVVFNQNKTLQRLQNAQAHKIEIENAWIQWWLGVIDQTGFAQRTGEDRFVRQIDEPPPPPDSKNSSDVTAGDSTQPAPKPQDRSAEEQEDYLDGMMEEQE